METVLATLYICIAQLAVAISPVIPASSAKLLDMLGIPEDLRNLAGSAATGIRRWRKAATASWRRPRSSPGSNCPRTRPRLMLVDSHCHLEYKGLVEDREGVLARARAAGVGAFLNISTRQSEWDQVVGTAAREPDVFASVGIHPHEADAHQDLGRTACWRRRATQR
jgi:hypothetical protein